MRGFTFQEMELIRADLSGVLCEYRSECTSRAFWADMIATQYEEIFSEETRELFRRKISKMSTLPTKLRNVCYDYLTEQKLVPTEEAKLLLLLPARKKHRTFEEVPELRPIAYRVLHQVAVVVVRFSYAQRRRDALYHELDRYMSMNDVYAINAYEKAQKTLAVCQRSLSTHIRLHGYTGHKKLEEQVATMASMCHKLYPRYMRATFIVSRINEVIADLKKV